VGVAVEVTSCAASWKRRGSGLIGNNNDAYGAELQAFVESGRELEIIERNDGFIEASRRVPYYFSSYAEWSDLDREAVTRVCGRTLDVGCGAGRLALHLQAAGHEVVAIDNSPGAIRICRRRGVEHALLMRSTAVSGSLGRFDTIALFGGIKGPQFNYLFLSPRELASLVEDTGWIVKERIESKGAAYSVVLAKE
jgi:2-polyprenyl-3-methyl-5-hydroxy-6-metoxy-1,4-benzoquinol methylase